MRPLFVFTFALLHAIDQDTTEIIETLNLILAQMATKDDVEALRVEMREGLANIQAELEDIRLQLGALEVATQYVSGFAKEIDHLLQRAGVSRSILAFTTT